MSAPRDACMDSKVVRAVFGSGLICPKGSNILRAEIQRALRRAPRQLRRLRLGLQTRRGSNHSAAHVSESNSRSNVFQISRACVPSRWKVLSGEFRRRPTALAIKFRKSDLVGRRGLSEPREDFSRLPTHSFPRLCQSHFNLRAQPLKNSAENCQSLAGSFHG